MVCNRCKTIVKAELDRLNVEYNTIELGNVITKGFLTSSQRKRLSGALQRNGLELVDENKNLLIERLRRSIVELEHHSDEDLKTRYSDYIRLVVDDSFSSLNTLFAEIEGVTIEKYIIKQKIELVKELLIYNDLNLAEIAHKMNYSSATQLSNQFKKVTGLTPADFRQLRQEKNSNTQVN